MRRVKEKINGHPGLPDVPLCRISSRVFVCISTFFYELSYMFRSFPTLVLRNSSTPSNSAR